MDDTRSGSDQTEELLGELDVSDLESYWSDVKEDYQEYFHKSTDLRLKN